MKKNIILKYILIYLPFIVGISLYSFGIYNIISSLLLFIGGYVSLKNTLDYRKVNKNLISINYKENIKKEYPKSITKEISISLRKIKKQPRVRKRTKQ